MRTLSLAAIFALAAIPVSAQQSGTSQNPSATKQMEQQSREVQAKSEGQNQQSQQHGKLSAMSKQKLRNALQEAGFTQINIVDAAYLVRAQTEDGDSVVMYINPPSMQEQSGTTGTSGTEGSFKTDSIRRAGKNSGKN